jgi:excisionase family DNA binding protein
MENLINEAEAAKYLSLSRSFMRQARVKGTGPVYRKFGRAVRFRVQDLDAWIESKARKNTITANFK